MKVGGASGVAVAGIESGCTRDPKTNCQKAYVPDNQLK